MADISYVSKANLERFAANLRTKFATKQDVISDLAEIRANAATGAGLKTKVDGIEAGAQVNIIETVKVNGTALTPDANKAVDVTVPTQLSDLGTETQMAAINSGINATKRAAYDALVDADTIAEYGITDAYTKTEVDGFINGLDTDKADKATTLAGYGITDAYTKTEVDGLVDTLEAADEALDLAKADKATTLAGYGITDAYTKTEIDGKISGAFHYKGSVQTYSALPASGQVVGDVYNIATADPTHNVKAGDNVAWDGTGWDVLSGVVDLSSYYTKSEVDTIVTRIDGDISTLSGDVYHKADFEAMTDVEIDALLVDPAP